MAITASIAQKTEKLEQLQLKMLLQDRLAQLEMRYRDMVNLETTLKDFSEKYFSAVGEYATQLNQVRGEGKSGDHLPDADSIASKTLPEFEALQDWVNDKTVGASDNRKRQLKESYRKLAQRFHPDHNQHQAPKQAQEAAKIMQQVNEAYERQDMAALLRLEIEYLYHETNDTTSLGEKLARCETLIGACIFEREILQHSAIFTLHGRYLIAQLAGEDFIDNVVGHIKSQIASETAKKMAFKPNIALEQVA